MNYNLTAEQIRELVIVVGIAISAITAVAGFAFVQWRLSAHEARKAMHEASSKTERWRLYFDAVKEGDPVTAPDEDDPPTEL